ncbi:EmrB/QacA subfamily drug resistance transporter [Streptomyces sp. 1114.5]|nr:MULTISPECIES: MFS transporter [unclassified Streptomyces]RKT15915.1 EmrB/QacA subfamily drug resistance transporter [Streptomyces sp. 1114.5]SOB82089.1 drug resistance transporter, EmrB/QacA subfamily [Streptomyces sp. 1331.2]
MTSQPATGHEGADRRRWWALAVIAIAQLMIVLDITIVNIALPSAQKDLGISDADRQWMITAYTLAFGGLLLLGGRLGDLFGRKRVFTIGLLGFALASAVGGAAVTPAMLFGARALQGAFGALLAPSALGLLSTTFSNPRERSTAFGIFGAIAGSGAAIGFITGGVLTEYLNWRWCLFVNTPIAIATAFAARWVLARDHVAKGRRIKLDLPGAVLGCSGLLAIVFGTSEAVTRGWGDWLVLGSLALGVALLACFVLVEKHTDHALLPLHIVGERNRGGAALSVGLAMVGMFGLFLFLTYYLQVIKHFSPVMSGVSFLPMTAAIITSSTGFAARLMNRVPSRNLITPGLLLAAGGMAWLTQMKVDSPWAAMVLPAQLLLGFGMGLVFMPSMSLATLGVAPNEAGAASATINSAQQVGGSFGTALLNTIAASATATYLSTRLASDPGVQAQGAVHGYAVATWVAMGVLIVAALVAFVMIDHRPAPGEATAVEGGAEAAAVRAVDGRPSPRAAAMADVKANVRAGGEVRTEAGTEGRRPPAD